MARRPGLGKGLDALIPGMMQTDQAGLSKDSILQIPIDTISPNPKQPRLDIDPSNLTELADSIRIHGIIQPLIVTKVEGTDNYTLIAGERRLRAAQLAGLTKVPVIMRSASEHQQLVLALIENIQREDLNPLEQASAYKQLMEEFSYTHEEIAEQVGKSRTTISNILRLLNLSDLVKKALLKGEISEGHARSLLSLSNPKAQDAALDTIKQLGLNVRQTEALVNKLNGRKITGQTSKERSPEITDLEDRLRMHFKTKVNLNTGKNGGSITIFFFSDEELNAILDQIF
jgi:ParB family chromosome partitioning protein